MAMPVAKFSTLIVFVTLIFRRVSQVRAVGQNVMCTEEFCEDYVERIPCPGNDPICGNDTLSVVLPSLSPCNCCEHCFLFQDLHEHCMLGNPGQPLAKFMCKPNTICKKGVCEKMDTPDVDFYRGYECNGEVCNCTVIVNGKRQTIFGAFNYTEDLDMEPQCGCSIFVYNARKIITDVLDSDDIQIPTPRCLPNGQYDSLQCINDMCGCVDEATGTWDTTVRKVPVQALAPGNPKCFNPKLHNPTDYYKPCERERNDIMNEKYMGLVNNINIILTHKVECDMNGNYSTETP